MKEYDITYTSDFQLDLDNRIDDFIKSLNQIKEIANKGKLLIIGGDIYRDRRPHPKEMNIFRDFIKNISVPVEIVIGNHDENLDVTTLDEFLKFNIKEVTLHRPPFILKYSGLNIYLDHTIIEGAKMGPSDFILNNKRVKPLKNILDNKCDFYLIGDIHKAQVVNKEPPVLYAGSIEREDFGERNEGKYVILINSNTKEYVYKPLNIRPMYQINLDLSSSNEQFKEGKIVPPQVENAIVKVVITGTKEQIEKYNEANLKESLNKTFSYKIQYNVLKEIKSRNTNINEGRSIEDCFKEYAKEHKFNEYELEKGMEILSYEC